MNKIQVLEAMIAATEKLTKLYQSRIAADGRCDFNDREFVERTARLSEQRRAAFAASGLSLA